MERMNSRPGGQRRISHLRRWIGRQVTGVGKVLAPGWPLLTCLLAMALRVHRLTEPLMRWDEGWSVAHASLSWPEIVQIASWEVHPPLFYLLFKPWLALGRNVFLVRFFPVLVSLLAVPVAFRVAVCWMGHRPFSKGAIPMARRSLSKGAIPMARRSLSKGAIPKRHSETPFRWRARRPLAGLTAGLMAVAPALVYYAQVTRMYPLVVLWLLLAAWALLHWLESGRTWALVGLAAASLAALYTFYYAAWALAGLYGYGLFAARRDTRRSVRGLLLAGAVPLALYAPWLVYAGGGMLQRVSQAAPAATIMPVTPWSLLASTWTALTFDFGSGGWAALALLVILVVAPLIQRPEREEASRLLMPLFALVAATGGVLLGSGAYFFAPRLLTPAVPFLVLLVAWSLEGLRRLGKVFLVAGLGVLLVTFWPTSSRFVYQKSLEVSGPFDPHEYHAMLSAQASPDDFVFFNELALAGWYEMDRTADDPGWGYALRWTPIVEPMERIRPRVERTAAEHARLWFVLYQGTVGPGAELKTWLDGTLYPYSVDWGSESMFLSYLAPKAPWRETVPGVNFGDLFRLEAAQYSARVGPAGDVGVALRWRKLESSLSDYRVVLQVWDESGTVLAHRDAQPLNWERPTSRWTLGELVEDHHGLLIAGESETPLHLAVSLHDADTGEPLPVAGESFLELGVLDW